jgi:hypothetical protein
MSSSSFTSFHFMFLENQPVLLECAGRQEHERLLLPLATTTATNLALVIICLWLWKIRDSDMLHQRVPFRGVLARCLVIGWGGRCLAACRCRDSRWSRCGLIITRSFRCACTSGSPRRVVSAFRIEIPCPLPSGD